MRPVPGVLGQDDSSLPVDPVRDNFDKDKNFVNPKISKFIPI